MVMGFSGVVMIMQPGANIFSLFSIFPILAALCYATSSTIVKIFPADRLSGVIQFRSQIFAALFSLLLWFGFGDSVPISSVRDLGLFIGLGLLGGVGVLGLVVAYRMSQPSLLAPFEYRHSFFAVSGLVCFCRGIRLIACSGVIAIVAGGMVIIWRQARAKPDAGS